MTPDRQTNAAVERWMRMAVKDAEDRGLPELKPLLEGLAQATVALRAADWNDVVAVGGRAENAERTARSPR